MDFEEWEILPDSGSLETHDEGDEKFFTGKYNAAISTGDIKMNYFVVNSSQNYQNLAGQSKKHLARTPTTVETDQETVLQDNQFSERKIEFPNLKSISIFPCDSDDVFEVLGISEVEKGGILASKNKSNRKEESKNERKVVWEEKFEGINLWKKSLNGFGAICSFGVAAATFCIIFLGNKQMHPHNQKTPFRIHPDGKTTKPYGS